MLTLFSTPKPFEGDASIIQTNAIRSWVQLGPECEVILFGSEAGTAELASQLKIRHIKDVDRNEYGTPLVNSLFDTAQKRANNEIICYVNADIILLGDFLQAIGQVPSRPFLLVGRRWDIDIKEPMDFDKSDWEANLRTHMAGEGKLHASGGMDYFVFRRGLYDNIPPFAIGRGGWDNWLVYHARALKVPVIDGTAVITAIHQNHDYGHHPGGTTGVWQGPEKERNVKLMGGKDYSFTVDYATFLLTPQGLKRALTLHHFYYRMRAFMVIHPGLHFFLMLFKLFEKSLGAIRFIVMIKARLVAYATRH